MGFLDRLKGGQGGPDVLTTEIVARLRAMPTVDSAEARDADGVVVRWTGHDADQVVDLGELRPRWRQASGFDRIELVDGFLEQLGPGAAAPSDPAPDAGPVGGWDQLRAGVRPVLRRSGDRDLDVCWAVGAGVAATVVLDGRPVTTPDCDGWGVGELDVRAAAVANLRALDPAPEPVGPGARAWVATAPAGTQAAWLVAPGPLLDAIGLVEGVAFAPLPGELVVVDPADIDLLRSILASTEQIVAEQAEPLTAVPFVLTAAGARPWEPAADHPLADEVAAVRRRSGAP
jgi:hypothetical protein